MGSLRFKINQSTSYPTGFIWQRQTIQGYYTTNHHKSINNYAKHYFVLCFAITYLQIFLKYYHHQYYHNQLKSHRVPSNEISKESLFVKSFDTLPKQN